MVGDGCWRAEPRRLAAKKLAGPGSCSSPTRSFCQLVLQLRQQATPARSTYIIYVPATGLGNYLQLSSIGSVHLFPPMQYLARCRSPKSPSSTGHSARCLGLPYSRSLILNPHPSPTPAPLLTLTGGTSPCRLRHIYRRVLHLHPTLSLVPTAPRHAPRHALGRHQLLREDTTDHRVERPARGLTCVGLVSAASAGRREQQAQGAATAGSRGLQQSV